MGRPGVIAFPVLLVLGAITGYLTYDLLYLKSTPIAGILDDSPYRKDLASVQAQSAAPQNTTDTQQPVEETPATGESDSEVVTILILEGSSISGAPDYDPDHAVVPLSATIKWVNEDSLPHSATSGAGISDTDFGSVFDTGLFMTGEKTIAAADIGAGDYTYFCIAHPFMVGTLTIE